MADEAKVYQFERWVSQRAKPDAKVYQLERWVSQRGPLAAYPADAGVSPATGRVHVDLEAALTANEGEDEKFIFQFGFPGSQLNARIYTAVQELGASETFELDLWEDAVDTFAHAIVLDSLSAIAIKNTGETSLTLGAPDEDGVTLWGAGTSTTLPPGAMMLWAAPVSFGVSRDFATLQVANVSDSAAGEFHLTVFGQSSQIEED